MFQVIAYAATITAFVLALIYKWFALDDRYAIFLYNHMQAKPFDEVTVGRYWMSGFVASAVVMFLYIAANILLARIVKDYHASTWWRVWLWCAPPMAIGIVLITTTQNSPTMPLNIAVAIALAALIGLALALMPGTFAAHRPRELMRSAVDGLGLVPTLLFLRAIEFPSRLSTMGGYTVYYFEIVIILFGVGWLAATNFFRVVRHVPSPSAIQVIVGALCLSYLVLPVVHHIFATPPDFKYITASGNFFAYDPMLQAVTFMVTAVLAVAVTSIRQRLSIQRGEK